MKTFYHCWILCLCVTAATLYAGNETAVYPSSRSQELPDIDNGIIVWQQAAGANGWDIYGINLADDNAPVPIEVAAFGSDQTHPAIWNNSVVWQDNETTDGNWNIWMADISDANAPQYYPLDEYEADQINPAIHGCLAVWQDDFNENNSDLYAADISDPANPYVFAVDTYGNNQTHPVIYRNTILYQDDYYGDWDVIAADVWLKIEPSYTWVVADEEGLNQTYLAIADKFVVWQVDTAVGNSDIHAAGISDTANPAAEFVVIDNAANQTNPDISKHIVVWQDNRNGHWDIYGYNLITRREFRITDNPANQTHPAISGDWVVWEDARSGVSNIYAVLLEGIDIADCPTVLPGDVDGNCKIDLADFTALAENWLACALTPAQACQN